MAHKQAKYRSDYRAPAFTIDTVELDFDLHDNATRVTSVLGVRRLGPGALELDGEQLKLISVAVDDVELDADAYILNEHQLIISDLPDECTLTLVTEINPSANSALEGLYKSGGAFCTQCEAEGFRRITYYVDRPDVLAVFTTRITADARQFPYLLSNGNLQQQGECENGRHFAIWHDPHPKPAYLFALVAGDFDRLQDTYTTTEGRDVCLEVFVDKGNLSRAEYAMVSLKKAMQWDEERFGLAYDLDRYMIVAVDFFNMGAMENKGLNIFNSKYVLADQNTATDWDFIHVESVIGHEYFHNWTGNRITCRDWFQLSLKEGLTVFRDQEFSSDLGSRAVHRIDAIRVMRSHQFNEDASPMAHPIRPDKVVEMNNFYTVTVYNKGAEVIRMLHTILGEEGFQRGMQRYRQRHDGQAVTCEDFVAAMEAANDVDLSQFRRWYSQAGTPVVNITERYDASTGELTIRCQQQTPATPGQTDKAPVVIPLLFSVFDARGQRLAVEHEAIKRHESGSELLVLDQAECEFTLSGFAKRPIIAWLENFSAPVKLEREVALDDYALLLAHAEQEVTRWEAAQQMYLHVLLQAVEQGGALTLPQGLLNALRQALQAPLDNALKALIFTPPSAEELSEYYSSDVPLAAIEKAGKALRQQLALALQPDFAALFDQLQASDDDLSGPAMATRAMANRCLYFLAYAAPQQYADLIAKRATRRGNMTVQQGALEIAVHLELPNRDNILASFLEQWQATPLVMDKWFAAQASAVTATTVNEVQQLTDHSLFTLRNPNRVYALLATFCRNSLRFHQADGAGYRLVLDVIKQLNNLNPQVAARLITPFLQWRRYDAKRQEQLKSCLSELQQLDDLAPDLAEKIASALES
ncbi:aminopeptidase N [Pseudidiomarina insulisalsae]|uniref:Aminopeptidase N n=1 Tax=Pseudidiomarina insulisalsae TaxID=575789 RepID=A0A432YH79_9GAMM|nr:aminopeptidase N [Pseudidiomarina insulisalsae]RUO60298.1 aminopeptidase N [Pseudidiomarina insulisalsae]